MEILNHVFVFCEIFSLTLQSYSYIIIFRGLLSQFVCYLLLCCVFFGLVCYFRVRRPPKTRVEHILGSDWGAYGNYSSVDECPVHEAVKVVGHRACGLDAPENSIAALNRMNSKGINMVEFDVVLTSDHIPVVFHDDNLYRVTNINKKVSELTLAEIQKLDVSVKHPFGKNFKNERIPTLYDFVGSCIAKNIKMIIDIKSGSIEMVKIINNLFKEFPELYDLAIVSSFNPIVIYQIRANDPDIVSSLCWRPYYHSHEEYTEKGPSHPRTSNPLLSMYQRFLNVFHYWFLWNIGYYIVGVSVILLAKDAVTREYVHYWRKRGIRLIAWCVNLPSEKLYFENNLQITYLTDTVITS